MGTNFVAVFLLSTTGTDQGTEVHSLTITTEGIAHVNIQSDFGTINLNVVVNSSEVIDFNFDLVLTESNHVTNKVLVIDSDVEISIKALTYRDGDIVATDSTLIHPTKYLSDKYIVMTAETKSQLAVIAIDNNTSVEIVDTNGDSVYSGTLQQNEVYSYRRDFDFTGHQVYTSKNAAVFSGHNFAVVPLPSIGSKDAGFVQLLGVQYFYKTCIMGPFLPDNEYAFRIVASENGTDIDITLDGSTSTIYLDAFQSYQQQVNNSYPVKILATKPILVVQFSLTSRVTGRALGDAAMVQCLNPEKYLNKYKLSVYPSALFSNDRFVRIVILKEDAVYLQIDGANFAANFTISILNYYILYKELAADCIHTIETTNGQIFGCDAYATGDVMQHVSNVGFIL